MKKLSLTLAFLCSFLGSSLLSSLANADGTNKFYVGGSVIFSNARYKYYDKTGNYPSGSYMVNNVDGDGIGAGASLGYKKSLGNSKAFISPELFYDYLNTSVKSYFHINPGFEQDAMSLRSRYGLKGNLGYDFNRRFSAYITFGSAYIDYINSDPSINMSQGKLELAQIYGIGATFNITHNLALKAEFNQQRPNIRYFDDGITSKVRLDVLKTGLVYSF
jgi:outer membrane autotransporter protein